MEETKDLINGINGWIDSLKEYPDNDSVSGLFEYLSNGCNLVISLNHCKLIYELKHLYRILVDRGAANWKDFEVSLEVLIDFAPVIIENQDELKRKREAKESEYIELEKQNREEQEFSEEYYKDCREDCTA